MSLLQALKLPTPPSLASGAAPAGKPAEAKKAATGPKNQKLLQAAEAWRLAHGQVDQRIAGLKAAVKSHCADAHPALLQEIEKGLGKLDQVLASVDHRLADSLTTAANHGDAAAQASEIAKAKSIVAEYIGYVNGEPMVAHMDQNPFGYKTELKLLILGGLKKAAQAVG